MKKILLPIFLSILLTASAQQKDVTTFLGIPVDGSLPSMVQKLKAKGFIDEGHGILSGKFNDQDVLLSIITYKNKVCRIMVWEKTPWTETDIKIRFNTLCHQFENSNKYIRAYDEDYFIPKDEDISYEMQIHNKRYDATFLQKIDETKTDLRQKINEKLLQKYTEAQIEDPTEEEAEEMSCIVDDVIYDVINDVVRNKCVWFTIMKDTGRYYIVMYYDNNHNRSEGDEL